MTLTNCYVTLDAVKDELGRSDVANDARIEAAIKSATKRINTYTGRRFWQDASVVTREFYADDYSELISNVEQPFDISTTTGLILKLDTGDTGTFGTTLTINTHFILTPSNAADDGEPFTGIRLVDSLYSFPMSSSGRPGVQITAKFGWATIPDDVVQACLIQSVLLYKATDAAMGGLSFGDGAFMRVRPGLNPTAKDLVDPYAFARVA